MAKKNAPKEQEQVFDFDEMLFDDSDDSFEPDISELMNCVLEACNNQQKNAIELTKMIVANSSAANMEEHVFSVFKKATQVVNDCFSIDDIMKKMQ